MKTILHIIDSLETGGAETVVVGTVTSMPSFQHIIVTLKPGNDYQNQLQSVPTICLNYKNKLSLPRCIKHLKRIINQNKVCLIHAHLLTSSFVARLSKPKSVPLVFSVHNNLSQSAFKLSQLSKWLEKLSYKKTHTALFVSSSVKEDYNHSIGIKGKSLVLYNFVENQFFSNVKQTRFGQPLRAVAVGSLKPQKNYPFLISAFASIENCKLDIYGTGDLKIELEALIASLNLNKKVTLKGRNSNLATILPQYDLFIMASTYEGFGIAPLEAMASGLPVFLSDIPVFREVTGDQAYFFNPYDKSDFVSKLNYITSSSEKLTLLSSKGQERAREICNKENYMNKLSNLYYELCL